MKNLHSLIDQIEESDAINKGERNEILLTSNAVYDLKDNIEIRSLTIKKITGSSYKD